MMTCREIIDFLIDYVSGALTAEEKDIFDIHLAVCPSCVAYLRSYQDTIRLAKDAHQHPDAAVPEPIPEELVQAILQARRKQAS